MSEEFTEKDLKEYIKMQLERGKDVRDYFIKRQIEIEERIVFKKRNLIRDVIIISTTVVAFVIPLTINYNVNIYRSLLALSAIFFIIEIIFGILLLYFLLDKDLKDIRYNSDKYLNQANSAINKLADALLKPTFKYLLLIYKNKDENLENNVTEENLGNKQIYSYQIFFIIFFIALTLLVASILLPTIHQSGFNFKSIFVDFTVLFFDIISNIYFK